MPELLPGGVAGGGGDGDGCVACGPGENGL